MIQPSRLRHAWIPKKNGDVPSCVDDAGEFFHLLGKAWTMNVLSRLSVEAQGFDELRRSIRPLSSKVLTEVLRTLWSHGLVSRYILSEVPFRTRYSITEAGKAVIEFFTNFTAHFPYAIKGVIIDEDETFA